MTKLKKIVIPDDNVIKDIYEVFSDKYPLADYLRDLYELSWQNSRKINEIMDRIND